MRIRLRTIAPLLAHFGVAGFAYGQPDYGPVSDLRSEIAWEREYFDTAFGFGVQFKRVLRGSFRLANDFQDAWGSYGEPRFYVKTAGTWAYRPRTTILPTNGSNEVWFKIELGIIENPERLLVLLKVRPSNENGSDPPALYQASGVEVAAGEWGTDGTLPGNQVPITRWQNYWTSTEARLESLRVAVVFGGLLHDHSTEATLDMRTGRSIHPAVPWTPVEVNVKQAAGASSSIGIYELKHELPRPRLVRIQASGTNTHKMGEISYSFRAYDEPISLPRRYYRRGS